MPAPEFTVAVLADLDRDGLFETDWTDRAGSAARNRYGLRWGMDFRGKYRIAELKLTLDNDDGAFTPEYQSGIYYGQLDDPGIPLKLQAVHAGITYSLFSGHIVEWSVTVGQAGTVSLTAQDLGIYLRERGQVNVAVATDRDTGEAIQQVLTAAGFTSADWDLDAGIQGLPYHFETNAEAMGAVGALNASELGGHFYVDGTGRFRFENRHSRLGPSQYYREVQRDNPILHIRFRESGGTTAYDHSGNGHHGTLQNSPVLGVAGLIPADSATAIDLEASSSQYITIPDHADLDLGDTLTIEALIQIESLPANRVILAKGTNGYGLRVSSAGLLQLIKVGVAVIASSTVTLSPATAYHVVATKSGASVHLYVDGVDVTGAVTNATLVDTSAQLEIGAENAAGFWDGILQDVALYPSVLSSTRVLAHYLASRFGYWGDGSTIAPCIPPAYMRGADEMVGKISATGRSFREEQEIEIWREPRARDPFMPSSVSTLSLGPGEVLLEDIVLAGTLTSLVTPASGVDYLANTANDGSGSDRTSNLAVTITQVGGAVLRRRLQNTHASDTIYVTRFVLRGVPLTMLTDVSMTVVEEDAAPGQPAKAEITMQIPWLGDAGSTLRDFAVQTFEAYSWPYPRLRLRFAWENDDTVRDMLYLDTGHLVRYWDRASGQWGTNVGDTWYIGEVSHDVEPGGQSFTAVTLIPSWLYRNLDAITWDDFDRADAVATLGISRSDDDWSGDSGWSVSAGSAIGAAPAEARPWIDLGQPNHDTAGALRITSIGEDAIVGVQFRRVDADNYLRLVLDFDEEMLFLDQVIAGVVTEIANAEWIEEIGAQIRWLAQGDRIRVWLSSPDLRRRRLVIDETVTALNWGTGAGLYGLNHDVDTVVTRFYAQAI